MIDKLIAKMEKNLQEEIRFSPQKYRGTELLVIRVYYDADGDRIPTKKGILIPLEKLDNFRGILTFPHSLVQS